MTDNFNGKGFDESPIEGDEAAKHRHMLHSLEKNWIVIERGIQLATGMQVLSTALKIMTPVAIIAMVGGVAANYFGLV